MYDESPGGLTDPDLWRRISVAALPATRDGRDFAQLLARIALLPKAEARDLVQEYRRFLYLSALDDRVRVPPAQLNIAWQLHARSPDYAGFCAEVLGKPLTIDDTSRRLGAATAYARTVADYTREFGERPPQLIWPKAITPRLPRWLPVHATLWVAAAYFAFGHAEPLYLSVALGLSLGLYGVDLWGSARARQRRSLGDNVSDDLRYFLKASGG